MLFAAMGLYEMLPNQFTPSIWVWWGTLAHLWQVMPYFKWSLQKRDTPFLANLSQNWCCWQSWHSSMRCWQILLHHPIVLMRDLPMCNQLLVANLPQVSHISAGVYLNHSTVSANLSQILIQNVVVVAMSHAILCWVANRLTSLSNVIGLWLRYS